jgi:squalene-hopene/tetraprenyl-beta-curcumene cyclase
VEETGYAVHALALAFAATPCHGRDRSALRRGAEWLVRNTDGGDRFDASPVGLYFANLWYSERLYPLIAATGALAQCVRLGV